MIKIVQGENEADTFNKTLYCGQMINEWQLIPKTCGARNWKVIKYSSYPPWARILICRECGFKVEVEIPDLERKHYDKYYGGKKPPDSPPT
jgi:hypothetical protein